MRIAILGNVTLDFFAQDFRKAGNEVYLVPGFDAWRQEVLNEASELHAFRPEAVLLIVDGGADNDAIALLHERFSYAIVVVPDLVRLAEETADFWDERMRKLAAMPFSLAGIRAIEEEFHFMLMAAPKKILALDADNTLWCGIISEDGADSVVPFTVFQKGVLQLRSRGVLLVLLSKNDPPSDGAPIVRAFAREDMPLVFEDFAAVGVNWSPKAGNLIDICKHLNLGIDSVVFVDDNPHERAQMKAHLPDVTVVDFPRDMLHPEQFLRRLDAAFFCGIGTTDEDRARAAMYRAEADRQALATRMETVGDYLTSLKLRCRAARAVAEDVPRLAQMAGKTNQFNATTIRRTEGEMAVLVCDRSKRVWTFRASDAFGDMGIVCYVVYDVSSAHITDFVMSCRAMGRTLEHFAINHVRSDLADEGFELAGIDFVPTAKNAPFKSFLESLDLSCTQKTYFKD